MANNSKHIKKSSKRKENQNKSYKKIAFVLVLILFIILIIVLISGKKEEVENKELQIILNNEDITSNLEEKIILENSKIYMSLEDVKKCFDETIYQEAESGQIITTSDKKVACLGEEREDITINGSKQEAEKVVIKKDEKEYIAISELEDVYDYEFNYIEDTNKITIDSLNKKIIKATIKKDTNLKEENKTFSNKIEKLSKGDKVIYIQEEGKRTKIRTQSGNIGYVENKKLENIETEREDFNENTEKNENEEYMEYDITKEDLSTFEKREKVINSILQQAIKNDKMCVKIKCDKESNEEIERFKIEIRPTLKECGVKVEI